jgi:hypothetical protein
VTPEDRCIEVMRAPGHHHPNEPALNKQEPKLISDMLGTEVKLLALFHRDRQQRMARNPIHPETDTGSQRCTEGKNRAIRQVLDARCVIHKDQ